MGSSLRESTGISNRRRVLLTMSKRTTIQSIKRFRSLRKGDSSTATTKWKIKFGFLLSMQHHKKQRTMLKYTFQVMVCHGPSLTGSLLTTPQLLPKNNLEPPPLLAPLRVTI